MGGDVLERSAEQLLGKRDRVRLGQRPQLHARRAGVLPERNDRVRAGLTRSDRRDHEGRPGARHMQRQRGRRPVEQMSVVEPEHRAPAVRARAQRGGARLEELQRIAPEGVRREQVDERRERDRRRRARRLGPLERRTLLGGAHQRCASEPGLADSGLAHEDHARAVPGRSRGGDLSQLPVAADEPPARHGLGPALRSAQRPVRLVEDGRRALEELPLLVGQAQQKLPVDARPADHRRGR